MRDWRRINVAFTRARSKLIIIGSSSTLRKDDLLGKFIALMERNDWVLRVPAGGVGMHPALASGTFDVEPEGEDGGKGRGKGGGKKREALGEGSPQRKRGRVSSEVVLKGKGMLQDILNSSSSSSSSGY